MTLPYTPTANAVIKRASRLASEFSHREVTTGHLLTSMAVRDGSDLLGSIAWQALRHHELDDVVTLRVLLLEVWPRCVSPLQEVPHYTRAVQTVLVLAEREAKCMAATHIGPEHLLLALLRVVARSNDTVDNCAAIMLRSQLSVESGAEVLAAVRPTVVKLIEQASVLRDIARVPLVGAEKLHLVLELDLKLLSDEQLNEVIAAVAGADLLLMQLRGKAQKALSDLCGQRGRRNQT